ncbi:hypothetical protein SCLCIDRAFT_1220781 [Scleroderma citrinum Foug A]|uniref:Uncharacterized protein n=1 Tax=Scleroderma citrinum Foug A TaxID=1036808 RepID=A0A0C2Z273_9AGAM|nr:hypothetical protein SCLCIDRAFT_1220781 [Scleroderma citrinum Foug A]
MANDYYCAVIGETTDGAWVYGAGDCPYIRCGGGTPPLPLAIQCKSENEARKVANTLQLLVNSLPDGADHTQLLAAFDNPAIRTLVSDEASFYAVVIGSPPGIHHTVESASHAERGFSSRKRRETLSFWIALAFVIVKGNTQDMPPLFTSTNANANTTQVTVDTLGEQLSCSLNTSSLHSASTSSSHTSSSRTSLSHPSISCSSSFSQDSEVSWPTSTIPARSDSSTHLAEPSPIIYSHIRNLRGIISSNYYPTSTTSIRKSACLLGDLAACYLTCHGYSVETVDLIIDAHRCYSSEQFIMFLAGRGMAMNEAKFLLLLIEHGAGANV